MKDLQYRFSSPVTRVGVYWPTPFQAEPSHSPL
jgi:hypothetical protein